MIMKAKVFTIFIILVLAFASLAPQNVRAQAYTTKFLTSITYQNVGTSATTVLQVLFYATPGTTSPIVITRPNLAAGASTSLNISGLSEITSPFQGSAVMQADQPLLATLVQLPQSSTTVYVRPLSDGFSDGSSTALFATVLKNTYSANTIFSIQNMDTVTNIVDIKFYNTSASLVHEIPSQSIESGASFYVDAGSLSALGSSFNGSVVATALRGDLSTPGKIIGSAMELDITGVGAKAYESVSAGANTIYMASALCNAFSQLQNTSYAVQNTSTTLSTDVTVTFKPGNLTAVYTIGPGAKHSFGACATVANGFSGSAVVTAVGAPVIAMGKVGGGGFSTAFMGQASGAAHLSLPYVRWAPDAYYLNGSRQRTSIAIQNVGSADIPANDITVHFTDSFGHAGSYTYPNILAVGAKFSANATNAGLTWFGSAEPPAAGYGGGAIIDCSATDCQLIAIARVQTYVSASNTAAEDYNGMAIP
jgi:hypothetical protein